MVELDDCVARSARRGAGSWPLWAGLLCALMAGRRAEGSAIQQPRDWSSWVAAIRARAASTIPAMPSIAPHKAGPWLWPDRWVDERNEPALSMQSSSGECQCVAIRLAGSHHVWPLHVKIPMGIRLVVVNGLLPDNPLVEYLRWRRSLNPARFDHWHPRIGPMLATDVRVRESLCTHLEPQVVVPPRTVPNRPVTHAPEPSTAGISLVLVAWAALARPWGRGQSA
jgi:hypothetical protein